MKRIAFITGIAGQDGSYLAELLLQNGYDVHGLIRRAAVANSEHRLWRLQPILNSITLHYGDITDYAGLFRLVSHLYPSEVYHLAAQSNVKVSFQDDFGTMHANAYGTHCLLEVLRLASPGSKFYFAGTSEMFGATQEAPQNENTPFDPISPYAISKVSGYYMTRMYRRAYDLFAVGGILFNHESPRRGDDFVTRKIIKAAVAIKKGEKNELHLGNLDARRDWGYAKEFVEAMWAMLQASQPSDYVIGTGKQHSVRDFVREAFDAVGLDWQKYVIIDQSLLRPLDVANLVADSTRARNQLGWYAKVTLKELVTLMIEEEMRQSR